MMWLVAHSSVFTVTSSAKKDLCVSNNDSIVRVCV